MLDSPQPLKATRRRNAQGGVVLLFSLILLVALTLASVALMRSVSTSNVIAGNLAFQQAATHSADLGIEAAITWLEANTASLNTSNANAGYLAQRREPAPGESWETFWGGTLSGLATAQTVTEDATGNTVSYIIQRMCNGEGAPITVAACSTPPKDTGSSGNSQGGGVVALASVPQIYYRITARVTGPRNSMNIVQAIVAM